MSENSGFIAIAKKYRLNPVLLREIILFRAKGYDNLSISAVTGINKNTVNKYVHVLRSFSEADLEFCMRSIFS